MLRTPRHYEWAIGKSVAVKAVPGFERGRRFTGTLVAAGPTGIELALDEPVGERMALDYHDIEKARSVFEWGPAPKPGTGSRPGRGRSNPTKGAKKGAGGSPSAPATPSSERLTDPPSGTEVTPS